MALDWEIAYALRLFYREIAMIWKIVVVAAIGAVGMLPAAAFADAASEIATATDHAGYAVAGTNLAAVRMHLHHAINCLVGPQGKEFDSHNDNPCANAGNGAIPDTTNGATKAKLDSVVVRAEAGISTNDQTTAKKDASDVYALLRAIK